MTQTEALRMALEALWTCSEGDYSTGYVIHPSFDEVAVEKAITAIKQVLAQPEQGHAEQLARLGWQYFECPACGSEGARAFPNPEQDWEAVAADQAMTIALLKVDEPVHRKPLTDTRVKVKLGSQYGEDLAGHWFFLQPADNFADAALAKHSGIEAAHGVKE